MVWSAHFSLMITPIACEDVAKQALLSTLGIIFIVQKSKYFCWEALRFHGHLLCSVCVWVLRDTVLTQFPCISVFSLGVYMDDFAFLREQLAAPIKFLNKVHPVSNTCTDAKRLVFSEVHCNIVKCSLEENWGKAWLPIKKGSVSQNGYSWKAKMVACLQFQLNSSNIHLIEHNAAIIKNETV